MQKRPWVLAVALTLAAWLVSGAANALPTGPVVSGNGQLEFSNFEFFSPGGKVNVDDIAVSVLADGIALSGPVDVKHGAANFFVTYDVRALGPGIDGVSLELDADPIGLVLSTKRILGDRGDPCDWWGDHKGKGDWFDGPDDKGKGGKFDRFSKWNHGGKRDFDSFDKRTLAFLKTMQVNGSGNYLVAANFAPQESIRVVEHVVVSAKKGAAWNSSTNRFSVVPEPGTATLTLIGLGVLALRSVRKS